MQILALQRTEEYNQVERSPVSVRQKSRRRHLAYICENNFTSNMQSTTMTSLIVDDVHRVIYCYIPKVACTGWKRTMVNLTGKVNPDKLSSLPVHQDWYIRSVGLKFLGDYSSDEMMERLRIYPKFLFVRHPLERLLSAFRDKFIKRNKFTVRFHHKYGRHIVQKFRRNPSNRSMKTGSDVTFPEFIKYIGHIGDSGFSFNPHWEPYHIRCDPCRIRYDFIGKMETMESDIRQVFNTILKLPSTYRFPNARHGHTGGAITRKYYKSISKQDLKRVIKVYTKDFDLFQYSKTIPF